VQTNEQPDKNRRITEEKWTNEQTEIHAPLLIPICVFFNHFNVSRKQFILTSCKMSTCCIQFNTLTRELCTIYKSLYHRTVEYLFKLKNVYNKMHLSYFDNFNVQHMAQCAVQHVVWIKCFKT